MSRDTQRTDWSSVAERRKELFAAYLTPAWNTLLDAVGAGPGTSMLDAGCGSGRLVGLALARSAQVTGIDLSPKMLEVCRRSPDLQAAAFFEGSIEDLPFADGSFDAATCAMAIHFCDDVEKALGELRRVIKPGGRVAISAPSSSELDVLIVFDVARKLVPSELVVDITRPLMFAGDGVLAAALVRAGFREITERVADTPLLAGSFNAVWERQKTWAPVQTATTLVGEASFLSAYQQALFERLGTRTPEQLDMKYRVVSGVR